MKLHLPNSAFLGNIDPFLRKLDLSNPGELMITAHEKWISIHPIILSMVAALGLEASKKECDITAKSRHYLERMGLFKMLRINTDINIKEHAPEGRFIPLTQITNSSELTKFITDLVPLLHLEPTQADPIKYVISELVRNVLEHAQSSAIVCAQYYQKSNTIRIGIVDRGVGIKETINNSYSAETDLEAIRLALIPGVTGTTRLIGGTASNAGAGLFFIKSIAQVNREFFIIYSGNAMYKLLKAQKRVVLHGDPFKDRHSKGQDYPYWQGTAIGVDISLDKTQEFSRLLDMIRNVYLQTIKERKRHRKPRFI